jgi:hypothetical protein
MSRFYNDDGDRRRGVLIAVWLGLYLIVTRPQPGPGEVVSPGRLAKAYYHLANEHPTDDEITGKAISRWDNEGGAPRRPPELLRPDLVRLVHHED